MQRHFSNRGEAIPEAAAAKMTAYRTPRAHTFSTERKSSITFTRGEARVPEMRRTAGVTKTKGPKDRAKSGGGTPDF